MTLRLRALPVALLCLTAAPAAVSAEGLSFSGGVDLTSNYLDSGYTQTDNGPALQPYFELGYAGFYFGLWASNVDFGKTDTELDLTLGYRGEFGPGLSYGIGYARYYYDDLEDSEEYQLSLGFPIANKLTGGVEVDYDPDSEDFSLVLTSEYALTDKWTIGAEIGQGEGATDRYGDLTVSYALASNTSVSLLVTDTPETTPRAALTLGWTFGN